MYRMYQTEALVIESHPKGEADNTYALLTRDFGLVYAHARGVRQVKSKLRFSLQPFSFVDVAMVRGKDVWRITNAISSWNVFMAERARTAERLFMVRSAKLLKRLLRGEEANSALFDLVSKGFAFLVSGNDTQLKNFEAIFVLRVLNVLGYVGDSALLKPFLFDGTFSLDLLSAMEPVRRDAILHINQSLKETHL